jgi:putative addiction module component (TIGR02574 family)
MVYPSLDLERLTVAERLQLIEQVWDSLRQRAGVLTLSEDERALIEARRAEHRADPTSAVEWEAVRAELLSDQDADDARTNAPTRR